MTSLGVRRTFSSICIILLFSLQAASLSTSQQTFFSDPQERPQPLSGEEKIQQIVSMIDHEMVFDYLKTLVGFGPRMTGTYGCQKAANYISQQFTENGLKTRLQNWSSWGNLYYPHLYTGQNIEGTLQGTETPDAILFNAHYDTVAAGPGANDDGSGTAAVLAAAYALSHYSFKRTIKFVTFAGEEINLIGSRAYAKEAYKNNDNILLEINADMIGGDDGGNSIRVTATEDAGWARDIFTIINQNCSIGLTVNSGTINREHHKLSGSDYASFLPYGWETVCCWQDSPDENFHTEKDNLSNINFPYLVNVTRIIAGTLAYLADLAETPPQVRITSPRVGFLTAHGMEKRESAEFKTTVIDSIWIWAEVKHSSTPIQRAEFFYDGHLVFIDTEAPFKWQFNKFSLGKHEIKVIIYDQNGRNSTDWREIRFINILKKIK